MNRLTPHNVFRNSEDMLRNLNKQFIGHDRVFDSVFSGLLLNPGNYPPYNIEKADNDHYRLTLAVAGFSKDELKVTVENGNLRVDGSKAKNSDEGNFLHKGIATRDFSLTFSLGEYIEVSKATVENGLLVLDLVREVPEAMKPKTIEVR